MLRQSCQAAPGAAGLVVRRHLSASATTAAASTRRGYREALAKLAELPSNRSATSLFEPSASPSTTRPAAHDLNAQALPEARAWLRRAGYSPQDLARMRAIHVAGTKGKGSVCAYATAMLSRYRAVVGTYTSPHLVSPRERIAINGQPVSQEVFAAAVFDIWDRLSAAARAEGVPAREADGPASKPFFFRFLTLMAWHIFLRRGIEDVVVEVGIGGEFDDTNLLPAEAVSAAVVTQLGLDHTAMLGDSVEAIAWHKAGIMKHGVRAFTVRLDDQPSVMEVLRARAAEKGAELVELDGRQVEAWGGVSGVLRGDFQKRNQALAVAAVREHLGLHGSRGVLDDIPDKMREGLRTASLRGRCEVVHDREQDGLVWMLDGAHTTDSLGEVAAWVSKSLGAEEDRVILLFNQQERDAAELLSALWHAVRRVFGREDVFCHAIFTRNEVDRPGEDGESRDLQVQKRAAERMAALAAEGRVPITVSVFNNLHDSVAEARRLSREEGGMRHKILVTGSLYLVGGVLQILEPQSLL